MPTRTLQETLRERISSGEAKQLRFWEDEASSKSSSGSSSGSYDGTIVKLAETISATEYLPSKPIQYLPLTNHPSQTAWNACRKHAVQILEDVGINWTSLLIQLERDSSNRIRPIMLIMVTDASRHELWRDTTILLDKMLYVRDIRDLAIEFSVPEGPDNFCFPIEPAHPLVALWPQKLRLPVVMILEQSTPWQTMSVFRYGLSNSSATPTVLITVPDIKSQDYSALEHVLNNELSRLHASSLRVKIVQGELNGRINAELPTGGLSLQTYAKLANMGCSIGTDDRGSGTLGGYVRISKGDGKTRICALTNFHVVRHFVPEWKAGKYKSVF